MSLGSSQIEILSGDYLLFDYVVEAFPPDLVLDFTEEVYLVSTETTLTTTSLSKASNSISLSKAFNSIFVSPSSGVV